MIGRAGDPLVRAIALAQAHDQGDTEGYGQIIANNNALDLIRGLIDLNRLVIVAMEPETGRDVTSVLDRLWSVNTGAASSLGAESTDET